MRMPLAAALPSRAASAASPIFLARTAAHLGSLSSRLCLFPSSPPSVHSRASSSSPAPMRKAQAAPLGRAKISHFFQSSKRVPAPAEGSGCASPSAQEPSSMPRAKAAVLTAAAAAAADGVPAGPALNSRQETGSGAAGAAEAGTRVVKGRNGEFLLKRPAQALQRGPGLPQGSATQPLQKHLQGLPPPQPPGSAGGSPYPAIPSLLRDESWKRAFAGELSKPYVGKLHEFLCQEAASGQQVFPPPHLVFNALNTCPLSRVRLVVIGQDPYHGPGQAMGLSFSVPRGVPPPSSLMNIFKELQSDLGCPPPGHGDLTHWAQQGVLLLNTVLTVRRGQPNSHAKRGWETLTDAAIRAVVDHALGASKQSQLGKTGPASKLAEPSTAEEEEEEGVEGEGEERGTKRARVVEEADGSAKGPTPVIFLLWGAHAQSKAKLLPQHSCIHVLKAPHPSGLSAHRGFFGCKHFSQANEIFTRNNVNGINWAIPRS